MKNNLKAIAKGLILAAAMIAVAALSGCVTSETITTSPDGTVTKTTIKATDAASISAAADVASVATRFIIYDEK